MAIGTYPGVYIRELASGVRTIVGVGTSIGMFIGRAAQGELFKPIRCLSFADFEREFTTAWARSDLARSVRLFFDNGGTDCYVMRISDGAALAASVMLKDEALVNTLQVTAKSAGPPGNDIRVAVTYNTDSPEGTFNLEVFRWVKASNGALQKSQTEFYAGLSMDKDHPRYCPDVINLPSKLISMVDPRNAVALAGNGVSISGFAISNQNNGVFQAHFKALLTLANHKFRLSVGGRPPTLIDLSSVIPQLTPPPVSVVALQNLLNVPIKNQLPPGADANVVFQDGPSGPGGQTNAATRFLTIEGVNADVYVEPASSEDLAGALMLGTAQGGIEIPRSATRRPAPNGVVFHSDFGAFPGAYAFPNAYTNFGQVQQAAVDAVRVSGTAIALAGPNSLQTTPPPVVSPRMYQDKNATGQDDGRDGVREKFGRVAAAINNTRAANSNFRWTAEVWGSRLAVLAAGDVTDLSSTDLEAGTFGPPFVPLANVFEMGGGAPQPLTRNVRYYVLGAPPAPPGAFYGAGVLGTPGGAPGLLNYKAAYDIIEREVDLFNLMVLPKDADHSDTTTRSLWGPASNFCEKRRAFLLMDPPVGAPGGWADHLDATDASKGVSSLRVGLAKQYSAVYFPGVLIREGDKEIPVGPSGAIAGLMARIDASRGVWKAAAGTEADLRGVVGVQRKLSDADNGVLNPRAVNALRQFPNGIVSWGARTMDGDDNFGSEYKYSCIRRLANFIEESNYRGLTWVVFEPNDEPLWAQIRLNVGAFMHNLFRQGAFQGLTPRDAYFVRCDSTTTTQNDINLGIVNIIVGFAPLKPAEFVVLYLKQIAGQIQT